MTDLKHCPLCGPPVDREPPVMHFIPPRNSTFEQYEPSQIGETGIQCGNCGLKIVSQSPDLGALLDMQLALVHRWNNRP